jgi:hypothetical protein
MKSFICKIGLLGFLLTSIFLSKTNGQAIKNDMERMIKSELEAVRKGGINSNDYVFSASNAKACLSLLRQYDNDAKTAVRFHAQAIKAQIAEQIKDSSIRQAIAEDFVRDCTSDDKVVSQYAVARLLTFKRKDFSEKAKKDMLHGFGKMSQNRDFMMICGTANVTDLMAQLRAIAAGFDRARPNWFSSYEWIANLALAKMGDSVNIDAIIAAVELELEPALRVTRLLKYIGYVNQPDCIRLLQKYLESTETLPSVRSEREKGSEYNQYALEFLATYMDDFPIQPRGIGYSKEELETARAFLRKRTGSHNDH